MVRLLAEIPPATEPVDNICQFLNRCCQSRLPARFFLEDDKLRLDRPVVPEVSSAFLHIPVVPIATLKQILAERHDLVYMHMT